MGDTNKYNENNNLTLKEKGKCTCIDCGHYRRKFENAEQTNSGKAVLIEMLQKELKKKENLYKDLIDEYEKLRFKHCSVVQELEGLKEIYKSIEDQNDRLLSDKENNKTNQKKLVETLKGELDHWKQQCKDLQDKILPSNDLSQRIGRVEKLLQNQGITMIDLVRRFLEELRNMNAPQLEIPTNCAATITNDRGDTSQIIKDLQDDNETLNALVNKLTQENKDIKKRLKERKHKLSDCLCTLQKNEDNLKNFSEDLSTVIQDRSEYMKDNVRLQGQVRMLQSALEEASSVRKSEKCSRNCATGGAQNITEHSQTTFKDKPATLEESNRLLANTVEVLADENKTNLQIIQDLSKKLKEYEDEKSDVNKSQTEISPTDQEHHSPEPVSTDGTPQKRQREPCFLIRKLRKSPKSTAEPQPENKEKSQTSDGVADPAVSATQIPDIVVHSPGKAAKIETTTTEIPERMIVIKDSNYQGITAHSSPIKGSSPPTRMNGFEENFNDEPSIITPIVVKQRSCNQQVSDSLLVRSQHDKTSPIESETADKQCGECYPMKTETSETWLSLPCRRSKIPLPQQKLPSSGTRNKYNDYNSQTDKEPTNVCDASTCLVTTAPSPRKPGNVTSSISFTLFSSAVSQIDPEVRTNQFDNSLGCANTCENNCDESQQKQMSNISRLVGKKQDQSNPELSKDSEYRSMGLSLNIGGNDDGNQCSQNSCKNDWTDPALSSKSTLNKYATTDSDAQINQCEKSIGCNECNPCNNNFVQTDKIRTLNNSIQTASTQNRQNLQRLNKTYGCPNTGCDSKPKNMMNRTYPELVNVSQKKRHFNKTNQSSQFSNSQSCLEDKLLQTNQGTQMSSPTKENKSVGGNKSNPCINDFVQTERNQTLNNTTQTCIQSLKRTRHKSLDSYFTVNAPSDCSNRSCNSKPSRNLNELEGVYPKYPELNETTRSNKSVGGRQVFLEDKLVQAAGNSKYDEHSSSNTTKQKSKIPTPVGRHPKSKCDSCLLTNIPVMLPSKQQEKLPTFKKSLGNAPIKSHSMIIKGGQQDCGCNDPQLLKHKDEVIRNLKGEISQLQNLKNEYDKSLKNNEALQKQLTKLEDKLKTGNNELPDYQQDNENLALQEKFSSDYDFTGIEALISTLKEKLRELENELYEKNAIILSLEACIDKSNEILGECEKEIRNIVLQNANLKKKMDQLERTAAGQNNEEIQNKISVLVKEYNELLNEAKEKDAELEKIKGKYDKLCSLISAKKDNLHDTSVDPQESISDSDVKKPLRLRKKDSGVLKKRKRKKCLCKDKEICTQRKCGCDMDESATTEDLKKTIRPSHIVKRRLMEKPSLPSLTDNCASTTVLNLTPNRSLSLGELTRNSLEFTKNPNDCELRRKDESIKKLNNDKVNLQMKLNGLRHDMNNMMKEQGQLKNGITCLLNEIINKLKVLTDPRGGKIVHSSPGVVANEVLDSLTQLEQSLSNKKGCNCMSEIKSKYSLDQHGIARQMYRPLFNKFFFDYSSESKSNDSSVDVFDITELEVEKDVNNSCMW